MRIEVSLLTRNLMSLLYICSSLRLLVSSLSLSILLAKMKVEVINRDDPMNYTNLIESCQAHLSVQYLLSIKLIRQK